jgi:hypothetical protein
VAQRRAESLNRRVRILDAILGGLVLILAFLLASFAVRNSDFFLHLANGRALADGSYRLDKDDPAKTAGPISWANRTWLFDWLVYHLYESLGGAGLVLCKAGLVVVLAAVLMRIRLPGKPGWLPAIVTALSLLTMSPRLLMQPAVVSMLFLALALWLLCRPAWAVQLRGRQFDQRLLLLPLFALWVNLDSWFLLGPLLVGLFWLGDRQRTPAWLLPACVLACLCGPQHIFTYSVLQDLDPFLTGRGLVHDLRFQRMYASPWNLRTYLQPGMGLNVAGLSYFVLVALSLLSFTVNRAGVRDWRLFVWLGFGLLGAWQVRSMPFFAVMAGPITVLNLQAAPLRARTAQRDFRILGRCALIGSTLVLLVLAWPGFLHGQQQRRRHVAWEVLPDPSLVRVATTLGAWQREGRIGEDERVFAFHPDVSCYCAWLCPEVKTFVNQRLGPVAEEVKDYLTVCHEFQPGLVPLDSRSQPGTATWQQVLQERHIALLVLYDPELSRQLPAFDRMARSSEQWALLRVDGQAVIFGWIPAHAPEAGGPFAGLRLNPEELTFDSQANDDQAPAAPAEGALRGPRRPTFWSAYFPPTEPIWESGAASMYMRLFEDLAPLDERRNRDCGWRLFATGLAGQAALPVSPLLHAAEVSFRVRFPQLFHGTNDRRPDLPLLTVRAARRATAANPDDGNAYLRLAQAYLTLRNLTPERSLGNRLSPLLMLRHVQIVTALENVLVLNPDLEAPHEYLDVLYSERGYLDAALDHRRAHLRLARRAAANGAADAGQVNRQLTQLEKRVQALEKVVQDRQNQFARASAGGNDPFARAQEARRLGLARQALDEVLLKSSIEIFGGDGARLELELLLMMGRVAEAGVMLLDEQMVEHKARLRAFAIPVQLADGWTTYPLPAYEWFRTCHAAATGQYDAAEAVLGDLVHSLQDGERRNLSRVKGVLPYALALEVVLSAPPQLLSLRGFVTPERELHVDLLKEAVLLRSAQGDLQILAGLLALESGQPARARPHFRQAALPPSPLEEEQPGRPLAVEYLSRMKAAGRE